MDFEQKNDTSIGFEQLNQTMSRYNKNKTMISPEDLNGRYKKLFQKLKDQLMHEVVSYLHPFLIKGIHIYGSEEGKALVDKINSSLSESGFYQAVGAAIYKDFDIEKAVRLTEEQNLKIRNDFYEPYRNKHNIKEEAL